MPTGIDETKKTHATEETPPFGGSWTTLYVVVLVALILLIALFYIFTRVFA